jgi:hypothetical protein
VLWARLVSKRVYGYSGCDSYDSYDKVECLLVLAWTRIRLEIQGFGTGGIYQTERTIFTIIIVL